MLSTSSYSKTMIRENLSRYWALPLLGLFGMFVIGILPILMSYKRFALVSEYAGDVMSGTGFAMTILIEVLAISASAWVFGYLHDPVSTGALHSMPVTRRSLFGSAVISGWILIIAPIIIFAFMTLILRGATSPSGLTAESVFGRMNAHGLSANEIYTLPHVLAFIFKSSVTATYVLAVSCLAAVLSGRRNIHALLAMFLLVLPNDLAVQIQSICNGYLFGFGGLDINYNLLGPIAQALNSDGFAMNIGYNIYYIVLSVVIFILSAWIYSKIKLERVGNSTTFPVVGDVLAVLLTLICTLGFSDILADLTAASDADKPIRFVVASVISSVIFYAIMRMIADSSPAVFNIGNLKKYGVCLAILAVILAFTALDITGYGRRVPEASEVASVHIKSDFPGSVFRVDKDFTDPKSIETALELQKAIIEDRSAKQDEARDSDTLSLTWRMKNGREMHRTYMAYKSEEHKATDAALEKLFELPEYREELRLDADKLSEMCAAIEIYGYDIIEVTGDGDDIELTGIGDDYVSIKKEDFKGLIEAINEDLNNSLTNASYKDLDEYSGAWEDEDTIYMAVEMTYKEPTDDQENGKYLTMSEKDKNTLQFLRDKGYIK